MGEGREPQWQPRLLLRGGQVTGSGTESKGVRPDGDKHLRLVTSCQVSSGQAQLPLQIGKQLRVTGYRAAEAAAKHVAPRSQIGLFPVGSRCPRGRRAELTFPARPAIFSPRSKAHSGRFGAGSEGSAHARRAFPVRDRPSGCEERSSSWLCSSQPQGPAGSQEPSVCPFSGDLKVKPQCGLGRLS